MFRLRTQIAIVFIALIIFIGGGYHLSLSHKRDDSAALRALADKGDVSAQYETAQRFERGEGLQLNYAQAGYYFNLAAQQGHEAARSRISEAHKICSAHSPTSLDEAHECQIDAEAGNPNAQVSVGVLYMTGRFLKKNPLLAVPYFDFAAIHGDSRAQLMMASFYSGRVLNYDPLQQYAWAATAAQRKDLPEDVRRTAATLRDASRENIIRNFDSAVLAEAEAKARFYINKYGQIYAQQ